MRKLCASLVLTLALALSSRASFAAPAPSPGPTSRVACIGLSHSFESVTMADTLARPLDDPAVLSLLDRLVHLEAAGERELLSATAARRPADTLVSVDRAVRDSCTGQTVRFATARFELEAARLWDPATIADGSLVAFAEGPLVGALGALVSGDRLEPSARATLLAGFPDLAPPTSAPAPAPIPCNEPDSDPGVVMAVTPRYPASGSAESASADVRVKVDLDARGFVRSTELYGVEGEGSDLVRNAFADETLIAVAASRYKAGRRACRAYGGSFLYRASYHAHQ
jgi:hypothetical protein